MQPLYYVFNYLCHKERYKVIYLKKPVLRTDYCNDGMCRNGDCRMTFTSEKYECSCFTGYTGKNCSQGKCIQLREHISSLTDCDYPLNYIVFKIISVFMALNNLILSCVERFSSYLIFIVVFLIINMKRVVEPVIELVCISNGRIQCTLLTPC